VKRRLSEALAVIEQREEPAEYEAPVPDSDKQRRMKSFTVGLPAGLYRRFKLACIDAGRTIAEEVLALVERRTEEMEVATAIELRQHGPRPKAPAATTGLSFNVGQASCPRNVFSFCWKSVRASMLSRKTASTRSITARSLPSSTQPLRAA
jgi:hypothetical protein